MDSDVKNITVNSEILCTVQHITDDLMVVKFTDSNSKSYQGVLLDSTKRCCTNHFHCFYLFKNARNIPFGVNPSVGFKQKLEEDNPRDYDSVCARRHTYYLHHDQVDRAPLLIPSGKKGSRVRLRARQVLCSKCSGVCNEKGQNLKENLKENLNKPTLRSNKGGLKVERPKARSIVGNLQESRSSTTVPAKRTKAKPRYFGGKKRKVKKSLNDCDININPTNSQAVDLNEQSKRLAQNDSLVPKLKRLAPSEIERFSDVTNTDLEQTQDSSTNSKVSSSTSSSAQDSSETHLQPLKMKFSNLKQNCSSPQYSIVQPETAGDDNKRICDESDNQTVKKKLRKSPGEKEKTAPVLKISIGKESHVVTIREVIDEVTDVDDNQSEDAENVMPSTSANKSRNLNAMKKAAKKAVKRAKKEAAKRSAGIVSPGRPYLGPKSPKAASLVGALSPGSSSMFNSPAPGSPAYTLQCPTSQKIIFRKIKKKKKKCKERENSELTETPSSTSGIDVLEGNISGEEESAETLPVLSAAPGNLCVGDVVWARSDCHLWWPGKVGAG